MASIPRREDILKKLERGEASELQAVTDSVATILNQTKTLPVTITAAGLGSERVRPMVLTRLKECGWVVTQANLDDKESDYSIR